MLIKRVKRISRHKRVRAKIKGTAKVPRLCVFRSARHIYAQLIDDTTGKTLAQVKDFEIKIKGKQEKAKEAGKQVALKALDLKIKKVVFDRGGYKYHGRVKAVADGAREGGLEF